MATETVEPLVDDVPDDLNGIESVFWTETQSWDEEKLLFEHDSVRQWVWDHEHDTETDPKLFEIKQLRLDVLTRVIAKKAREHLAQYPTTRGLEIPEETRPAEQRQRFTFLTPQTILKRPAPDRLVEDFLLTNSTAMIFGDSDSLKSFMMLDLSLCVAGGYYWHDRPVKPGPVLYISAEGGADLPLRLRAWSKATGRPLPDTISFLEEAVRFLEPRDVSTLLARIAELPEPPVLIVIDTLGRATVGADENSTRDMGLFVESLDLVRHATGACVAAIHHTNKAGMLRGNSSLRAGMDTVVSVSRDDDVIKVECDKQKGLAPFKTFRLEAQVIQLDEFWPGESSLSLSHLVSAQRNSFDTHAKMLAETFVETFGDEGATTTQMEAVCLERKMSRAAFYRARKTLVACGFLETDKEGRGARYRPTAALMQHLEGLRDPRNVSQNLVPGHRETFTPTGAKNVDLTRNEGLRDLSDTYQISDSREGIKVSAPYMSKGLIPNPRVRPPETETTPQPTLWCHKCHAVLETDDERAHYTCHDCMNGGAA